MVQEQWVTVEEAGELLGRSVATVRRWASQGKLESKKVGRQWVIDSRKLPRSSRPVGSPSVFDFGAALRHVRHTDLKEVWVPDLLRFEDQLADPDSIVRGARDRVLGAAPFSPVDEVAVPKSSFFSRAAQLLTLEDRVAFHAVVASVAGSAEVARAEAFVFSAARSPDPNYLLRQGVQQWLAWRNATRLALLDGMPWMVKTDITAYFDNIQHRLLLGELESLGASQATTRMLREMLGLWSAVPDVGIPQGPDASRLLGNIYLYPVDRKVIERAVADGDWKYFRYMDDIRIVGKQRSDVVRGIQVLERECRLRGLTLSSQKTVLLQGDEALSDFEDHDLATATYLQRSGADTAARSELKKILRAALKSTERIDSKRLRFSLWRLRAFRDSSGLKAVLANLEALGPVASIVSAYLRPWLARPSVEKAITEFLFDPTRNSSPFLSTWLMASMLDRPGSFPAAWSSYGRGIASDYNEPVFHRVIAANVMARSGSSSDRQWLVREANAEFNPQVVRGYVVALRRMAWLDRQVSQRVAGRFPELGATLAYLRERSTLPSLVYSDSSRRARVEG